MSDIDDEQVPSPDAEGTTESPEQKGTSQPDPVELARRRQAGAEKAREVAEAKARELAAKLAKYEQAAQTDAEKDLSEQARLTERLAAAEKRAQEAEAKAEARILDIRYPNARAKLPEVTDEVRLAEFEAILAEDPDPGTPERHNESRTSTTATRTAKEQTAAEARDALLSMKVPEGWL